MSSRIKILINFYALLVFGLFGSFGVIEKVYSAEGDKINSNGDSNPNRMCVKTRGNGWDPSANSGTNNENFLVIYGTDGSYRRQIGDLGDHGQDSYHCYELSLTSSDYYFSIKLGAAGWWGDDWNIDGYNIKFNGNTIVNQGPFRLESNGDQTPRIKRSDACPSGTGIQPCPSTPTPPTPTPTSSCSGNVILYEHGSYAGLCLDLPTGNTDLTTRSFGSSDTWNDKASSVKVGAGYTVRLYEHSNFNPQGNVITITGPANQALLSNNDWASSATVSSSYNQGTYAPIYNQGTYATPSASAYCEYRTDVSSCTGGDDNVTSGLDGTQCRNYCGNYFSRFNGSGCWVLAGNGNCYCRGGTLNTGGRSQGGTCPVYVQSAYYAESTYAPVYNQSTYYVQSTYYNEASYYSEATYTPGLVECGPGYYDIDGNEVVCDKGQFYKLLSNVFKYLIYISGLAVVLSISVGGFFMVISAGSEEKLSYAKKTITGAVVGFIIVLTGWIMVNTVISVFTNCTGKWYVFEEFKC